MPTRVTWTPDSKFEGIYKTYGAKRDPQFQLVSLSDINFDLSQAKNFRNEPLNLENVDKIVTAMMHRIPMPAIVLWKPKGTALYDVYSGVHRSVAAKQLKQESIMAYILPETSPEWMLADIALKTNLHGMREEDRDLVDVCEELAKSGASVDKMAAALNVPRKRVNEAIAAGKACKVLVKHKRNPRALADSKLAAISRLAVRPAVVVPLFDLCLEKLLTLADIKSLVVELMELEDKAALALINKLIASGATKDASDDSAKNSTPSGKRLMPVASRTKGEVLRKLTACAKSVDLYGDEWLRNLSREELTAVLREYDALSAILQPIRDFLALGDEHEV